MWTIIRATPIKGVANLLIITMAFLVVDIARAASTNIVENEQKLTTNDSFSFKKALLDAVYIGFIKYFVYFLYFILFLFPDDFYPNFLYLYPIDEQITSTTTRVIFTRRKHNNNMICLKPWQLNEKVCNDKLVEKRVEYLLEGLEFNRRFARGVYLGIATVEFSKKNKIRRGKLIEKPRKSIFKPGIEYALVMRRLNDDWRLDKQLCQGKLGTIEGMKFLAKEVARMHKRLEKSQCEKGTPNNIALKLALNKEIFEEALYSLASNSDLTGSHDNVENYGWISNVMDQACKFNTKHFQQRYENDHIKRCHGDLKATNLWVRPRSFLGILKKGQELIALDCVDFNPDLCHIDTLSDVAMLAIDIEMHLTNKSENSVNIRNGQKLAKDFLDTYLSEMQENGEAIWPLLEYYMTEKSMVCAYVSILYKKSPEEGKKYLDVALGHAGRLQEMLKSIEYSFVSQQVAITEDLLLNQLTQAPIMGSLSL